MIIKIKANLILQSVAQKKQGFKWIKLYYNLSYSDNSPTFLEYGSYRVWSSIILNHLKIEDAFYEFFSIFIFFV